MQSSPVLSLSPSFNSYSSGKLAEIAARVVEEFRVESESQVDDLFGFISEEAASDRGQEKPQVEEVNKNEDDEDDDFEFAFVCREPDSSPISADEIFYNGQIRPIFPIFKRDLLLGSDVENESSVSSKPPTPSSIRIPLRKLLIEEQDPSSCSSSEADELDEIAPGTYCVWTPKAAAEESPGRCKKSNSTGSSKRWKFRDLMHRSNSDGKDTFVFLTPSTANAKKADEKVEKATAGASKVTVKSKSKGVAGGQRVSVSAAHEEHYVKNRAMKEGDPRREIGRDPTGCATRDLDVGVRRFLF
ncbi:hypothetical protein F0562_023830 [Nyssa sinensis]|uniref:Uncharacterized protein n=1 Tax=Nyssa sinensis TaxID=561372 RepID=A0A5J5BND6_9ASTE|nr:hypothetical protein F0562_023830 [Nyssa sinensis]